MALHWISVLGDLDAGVGVGVAGAESVVGDAGFDAWGCVAVVCAGVLELAWVLGAWKILQGWNLQLEV